MTHDQPAPPAPSAVDDTSAALGDDEPLLAAFVGHGWDSHYRASFAAQRAGRKAWRETWNKAALLAPMWLAYRRMLGVQFGAILLYLFMCGLAPTKVEPVLGFGDDNPWLVWVLLYGLVCVIEAAAGDRLLYARASRALRRVRARVGDRDVSLAAMRKAGGTSFTGVALLLLLLVLQVLYIAVTRLSHNDFPGEADVRRQFLAQYPSAQDVEPVWALGHRYAVDFHIRYRLPPDSSLREQVWLYQRGMLSGWTVTKRDTVPVGSPPGPSP